MRQLFTFLLTVFALLSFTGDGYISYPQDYFVLPVNHPIKLSGTFGELRPNHLHAGIDIKSRDGRTGQSILSSAEGTVSRINVRTGGYGKALYIDHPNGYTTVYAHLNEFTPEIEAYVKEIQYQKQSFEVEIYPTAGKFNFEQGEKIGTLGLSGRSYGPHLHFEIRDTESEHPINPLLFGLECFDNIRPKLHQLKLYSLNDKRETVFTKTYDLVRKGKNYGIKGDTIAFGAWRAGLAVKVFDQMPGASNWNGAYSISMHQDDQLIFDYDFDRFSFSESRYCNAHLDYKEQVSKKSYFNRLFTLPGNLLSIYNTKIDEGVIALSEYKSSKITIIAEDIQQNISTLEFWIKRKEVDTPESATYNYILPFDEENQIENANMKLFMESGSLYENLYLEYQTSNENSTGVYSPVHHLQNFKTPVHKYFDLSIKANRYIPEELKGKAFIAYCGKNHKIENCGGTWEGDFLKTKVRAFGDYSIMIDQNPPTVKPVNFNKNLKGVSRIDFIVKEDIDVARNLDVFEYNAFIDGRWVLMHYDPKKDKLSHFFDDLTPPGEHIFRLEVTDNNKNVTIFEKSFVR